VEPFILARSFHTAVRVIFGEGLRGFWVGE